MNMISTPLARFALGIALVCPITAQAQDASTVLATVGGETITLGHIIAVRESLPPNFQQLEDDVLYQGLLDQIIRQVALSQSLGDTLSTRSELAIESQRWALLANSVVQDAAEGAATEAALREAYDARYGDVTPEQEFNASHILVATQEEALELVEELKGGADFAELAKSRSTGPSGPNGGALGWFGAGMMVPEFETAVMALEPESVSDPVQTQFGWHVIRLNETRAKDAPAFESVREALADEVSERAVGEAIESLLGATEVVISETEIDPALIRDSSLID